MLPKLTIGLDSGDKLSRTCGVDASGKEVLSVVVVTAPAAEYSGPLERCEND